MITYDKKWKMVKIIVFGYLLGFIPFGENRMIKVGWKNKRGGRSQRVLSRHGYGK